MKQQYRLRPARGFTLVELLVVVAIISLLLTILMPSLEQARALARRAVCVGKMRKIFWGCWNYAEDNEGMMCTDSRKQDVTWRGVDRTDVWVIWTSEIYVGRYIDNRAITCSAIWPPPEWVSDVIYCSEVTMGPYPKGGGGMFAFKSEPWKNGIGLNHNRGDYTPLHELEVPGEYGFLADAAGGDGRTPSSSWRYATEDVGGIPVRANGHPVGSGAYNDYRHLETSNITYADGHVVSTANAVAEGVTGGELRK